jgi:protein-S-isoprenylcysteine O-methyltransferase Ste14
MVHEGREVAGMERRYRRGVAAGLASAVLLLGGLFALAGRFDYWQGWVFAATCTVGLAASAPFLRRRTDLIAERFSPGPGTKPWDKVFWALYVPAFVAVFVVAALDGGRHRWTRDVPLLIYGVAWLVFGFAVFLVQWAKWVNRFFSTVVRIQSERGHAVVDAGPYRFVRHPGYLGGVLMALSIPVVLGSYWGLVPGVAVVVLIVARTCLEDGTLRQELPGYREYAERVRYRLVPGVW